MSTLSSGIPFFAILEGIPNLHLNTASLKAEPSGWPEKLTNLRRLVESIEEYFEKNFGKGLKTGDIDLV